MATKMPRAVVDLDDFAESDNIMIYADTGVGKTELVSQLPGRVLVISSENGTSVIKRSMKRRGVPASDAKRFKVWPIRKFMDLEEAYAWLRDNPGNFDWVAIDSATSVQQRAMRAAMEIAVGRNPEKRDIDLPDRGEHQKMQNAMKRMIADFNELPENILWLAQAMRREDKDGNEIVVPFIMGKDYEVSAFACAQMQAFGYMMKKPNRDTKGVTDRVIIWDSFVDGGGVNYWSKDRYDAFPKVCVMSSGDDQKMVMTDLLDMITAPAKAKAVKAVETRDDVVEEPIDVVDDDDEPDVDVDEDDEYAARRAELMGMTRVKLAAALKSVDLDPKDFKGISLDVIVESVIEAEADAEALAEDEPEEDEPADEEKGQDSDDAEADEDEPADEEDNEERRIELMSCTPVELKNAVEAAGMTVAEFKGVARADIVQAILEAESDAEGEDEDEPEDDGEDELDLDGMTEDEDEPEEDEPAQPAAKKTAAPKKAATKAATTRRFRASDEDA